MSDINPTSISIPTSAASALIGDPAKFGYVAPDGTVFVKTSTGDKLRFVATRYAVKSIGSEVLIYPNVYTIYPKDVKLNIAQGEIVQMSPNLPNIKQSDLFQWCYKMFNWVIVVDDNKGQVQISTYDSFYQHDPQKFPGTGPVLIPLEV